MWSWRHVDVFVSIAQPSHEVFRFMPKRRRIGGSKEVKMGEMVERVADAILEALAKNGNQDGFLKSELDEVACAAIKAMREPDDMMFMKGGNTPPSNQGRDHLGKARSMKRIGDLAARECWQTMVDEALRL
jgi:hypothetical protein